MPLRQLARVATIATTLLAAFAASANDVTYYPGSPGTTAADGGAGSGAPGFGSSSFKLSGNTKGEVNFTPGQLFGHAISIADIASIGYWTNKPGNAGDPDWSFYIYTNATGSGDTGGFYHSRLTTEPYYTNSASDAPNTWHQWTSGGAEPMLFYDQTRSGLAGTYTDPTLATLQAGPYQWANGTTNDYRTEGIFYFALQTGSAWSNGFMGMVDGVTITLRSGEVGRLDLESGPTVVPEPESLPLLALGTIAVAIAARRRRR